MRLEVDIRKTLRSEARTFELRARFASEADVTVIFGASGAGKSVTLRAIAGLEKPEEGRIAVDGRVLFDSARGVDLPARERAVGYVFQDYALFPHLTVGDNIAFSLCKWWQRSIPRAAASRVSDLLEIFELQGLARSYPWQLSGGQRQRVALARALAHGPGLLLLDEPLAALDPLLRERVRGELLGIQLLFKVPMLLITHDPDDVATLANQVIVFEQGRVISQTRIDAPPYRDGKGRTNLTALRQLLIGPATDEFRQDAGEKGARAHDRRGAT